jgi:hypothetical protein
MDLDSDQEGYGSFLFDQDLGRAMKVLGESFSLGVQLESELYQNPPDLST